MQTRVDFQGDYAIVQVSGRLDIDKTPLFKQACLKSLKGQKVIFSLQNLNFVGSTGIQSFFHALKEVHLQSSCRVVGLSADFKKIIHLAEFQTLEFHESVQQATESFNRPTGTTFVSAITNLEMAQSAGDAVETPADAGEPERNS